MRPTFLGAIRNNGVMLSIYFSITLYYFYSVLKHKYHIKVKLLYRIESFNKSRHFINSPLSTSISSKRGADACDGVAVHGELANGNTTD